MADDPPSDFKGRTAVEPWKHSNPASGSALAEKRRCGIPVNGSAAMTDTAMVHACGVPAAG
jgi:hypothetical protein